MIQIKDNYFYLNTKNTSYIIRVLPDGTLNHCYYGKRIPSENLDWHNLFIPHDLTAPLKVGDEITTKDALPQEYPTAGRGDFREPAIILSGENGRMVNELAFVRYAKYEGVSHLEGLPHLDTCKGGVDTIELVMVDRVTGAEISLVYTVFEDCDVVARHTVVRNITDYPVKIHKVASVSLDIEDDGFDALTLHGAWARERNLERYPLHHGQCEVSSRRGASGHHSNPFMALLSREANEFSGDVYGMALIYSGDFKIGAQLSQFDTVRFYAGLNDDTFCWILERGETFTSPQAMLTFSQNGLNGMSANFHKACRCHLGACALKQAHPIVLNLWEAFYFDINEERVLKAITQAAALGIDTFVIDDGWFGNRSSDKTSLGDWVINREKFPNGFDEIVNECEKNNIKLGIWFDPESINQTSDLFKQHPDWAICIDGIDPVESRNQLLLDFSKHEVIDYIFSKMSDVVKKYNIRYIKWDYNRNMTDNGSNRLLPERQGEHSHRYMLGVYSLMSRMRKEFPEVFFEGSSGGGGRFDFGMLYYMPQIWTSDNSDAFGRMKIQYGTSIVYPPETISAHVSVCPNRQTNRTTPFETRENVAQLFSYGFELDLNDISDETKTVIKEGIQKHRRIQSWLADATFYRLLSPFSGNTCAWQLVSADKKHSVMMYAVGLVDPNFPGQYVKPMGLDPNAIYVVKELGITVSGAVLMGAGIPVKAHPRDFDSQLFTIEQL